MNTPTFAMLRDALEAGYAGTIVGRPVSGVIAEYGRIAPGEPLYHPLWQWALSHGMWQAENHLKRERRELQCLK